MPGTIEKQWLDQAELDLAQVREAEVFQRAEELKAAAEREEEEKREAAAEAERRKRLEEQLQARIRQDRPGIGDAPMFPSRDDPTKPITRHVAHDWLEKAEALADLAPLPRGKWHPFRRDWATRRQGRPNQNEVAHAGGWANPRVMEMCYQYARMKGMLSVVVDEPAATEGKEAHG